MKTCECGAPIEDKYDRCINCYKKLKAEQPTAATPKASAELITALGQINNNLYALRTLAEHELYAKHKKVLVWDKIDKRFRIGVPEKKKEGE